MKVERSWHCQAIVAAIFIIVFVLTCAAHEVVGHGGMCTIVGGHITLISSVYFRSASGGALTDAAGPLMNLLIGVVLWLFLRTWKGSSSLGHLFLVLAMGLNLFWGAGCFILSAITKSGDWAFVLHQSNLEPVWAGRLALGALGIATYRWAMRLLAWQLPIGTPLFVPYLVPGIFSCVAALFFFGPVGPAVGQAALEGFGVGAGLLLLAIGRPKQKTSPTHNLVVANGNGWLIAAALLALIFIATLGRGFGSAGAI